MSMLMCLCRHTFSNPIIVTFPIAFIFTFRLVPSDNKFVGMNCVQEGDDEGENGDGSQENGADDNSDCDNVSEISGLSDLSMESRWNTSAGLFVLFIISATSVLRIYVFLNT